MANQVTEQVEDQTGAVPADPWEAAFAALDSAGKGDGQGDTDGGHGQPGAAVDAGGQQGVPDQAQPGDLPGDAGVPGGMDIVAGGAAQEDGDADGSLFGSAPQDVDEFRRGLEQDIRDQAIDEIAKEFVKRNVRNRNGVLGATLDDADICRRDKDGVPHFYNPETGNEFRGDNPRAQAQEWVDSYNKELARVFNDACERYEQQLMEDAQSRIKVVEFAPKYEALDPIRRGMLDNVIEDYEVKDSDGKVVGYSCDLDKALALVDRQVAMIQRYAKEHGQQQQQQQRQASMPALDMKSSSGGVQRPEPTSLAEAMERAQDELLAKMNQRNRR